ncbi:hypothetical protein ACFQGI_18125 [Halobellus sp. GCM10025813]
MPDNEQIHISVPATTKEVWQRKAREEGYGTLTNLITTAVEHELDDDYVRQDVLEEYGAGAAVDIDLSEIESEFDTVRKEIQSLREEVMNVAGEEGKLSDEEIKDVAFEVHDILPSYQDEKTGLTLSEIVDQVRSDVDEEGVKEALLFLESNPHVEVDSDSIDNERRWFRA